MQEEYKCPVCGKVFIKTVKHNTLINYNYTCSDKCFFDYVKMKSTNIKKSASVKKPDKQKDEELMRIVALQNKIHEDNVRWRREHAQQKNTKL